MAVENDALQIGSIVRHIWVSGRDLKLQVTAAGDLDAGETQAQALHIIRKVFTGEVVSVKKLRDLERGLGLHHGIGLFVHNRILLKIVPTAQAASSSVRFICRKRAGDIVITLYPISSSFVARS